MRFVVVSGRAVERTGEAVVMKAVLSPSERPLGLDGV